VTRPDTAAGRRYYNGVSATRRIRSGFPGAGVALLTLLGTAHAGAQSPAPVPATLLAAGHLDPRWSTGLDAALEVPPAFDLDSAYLALRGGRLVAVDLTTGRERWSRIGTSDVRPATGEGLVFVAGDGVLAALEPRTGSARWQATIAGRVAAPLYWDTGWLIVSLDGGDLLAFRASDGEPMWQKPLGAPLAALPAPALDRLYLGLTDGRIVAIALASGAEIWTREIDGAATGLLALDEQLVVGATARAVFSFDLDNARQRWRWRLGAPVLGAPTADDDRIFFVTLDNTVRALDRRNGHLSWRQGLPSRPAGPPLRIDGHVLVPLLSTEMRGYDAATGRQAFLLTAAGEAGASPHVRPGARATGAQLITITLDGRVQAFGPRIEPAPVLLEALPGTPVSGEAPEQPAPPTQVPPAP
jgi:outer membrane protein assembly factor BamB